MPLFELEEGTSRKFYRIERVGTEVRLHWGPIGGAGKQQVLEHADEAAARAEYERQIYKRKERGYRQVHNEHVPHDAAAARVERLAAGEPLTASPRYMFVRRSQRWFVWLETRGDRLVSAEGTLGEEGKARSVEHPCESPAAANRERDRRIAALLARGFELGEFAAAPAPAPRRKKVGALQHNRELEALLREVPDDQGTWTVLEDWLIERDDPRGAIIEHERAKQPGDAAEAHGRIASVLLGPRAAAVQRAITGEWRAGYLRACTFDPPARNVDAIYQALLAAPAATLISQLSITAFTTVMSAPAILEPLAHAACAPAVRSLGLTEVRSERIDAAALSPLTRLEHLKVISGPPVRYHACLARLQRLWLLPRGPDGLVELFASPWPALRELTLDVRDVPAEALYPIVRSLATSAPALTALRLFWIRDPDGVGHVDRLDALLARPGVLRTS